MSEENEILTVAKESALVAFTDPVGMDPFIDEVRRIVDTFEHDLSTGAGRKRTAALAAKVSRFKVRMDDMGKDLVYDWKQKAKVVDDVRKKLRDDLDALRDQARAPLTAWEQAEERRVADLRASVEAIKEIGAGPTSATCQVSLDTLESLFIDERYAEFQLSAMEAKEARQKALKSALEALLKQEAEADELARLRAEAEARRKADAEEALRKEGEERARKEAEAKIRAEQARIEAESKAKEEAAEKAELAARRAQEDAERKQLVAEAKAKADIEQAERAQKEAEERARQAEAKAKAEADANAKAAAEARAKAEEDAKKREAEAVAKAKRDADEAKRKEDEDTAKRKANADHQRKLKTEAKVALMAAGVQEAEAVKAIIAICDGKVPNILMRF